LDTQQAWTIVPVRGLATGKTRLSPVLDTDGRRQLCTRMLLDTLAAVEGTFGGLGRCIVVSADPAARATAVTHGARALGDPPGAAAGRTLDAALDAAREVARAAGARQLLLISADMPDIDAHALLALLQETPDGSTVLLADKSGSGTNGMLLPALLPLQFAFGPGSLERHAHALAALGIDVVHCSDRRLAFDIDTPADLEAWQRAGGRLPRGPARADG
jgi:2-phospho-L-lactate guanylyltransferase